MEPEGGETDKLMSSRINRSYPRDLLRRFACDGGNGTPPAEVAGGDMGEIELGLSLGGCYGTGPKDKRLVRASSMTLSMFPGERIDFPAVTAQLTRACSLPTETEEERRKRKELECLKRMEAKRKRSEKRAAAANSNRKEDNFDEDLVSKAANGVVVPAEVAKWAAASGGLGGARPASQGSIGSQGSSSSVVSDFESRPVLQGVDVSGLGNCAEVRSPATLPSAADRTNHRAVAASPKQAVGMPVNLSREGDEQSRKKSCTGKLNGVKEMDRNVLEEMPCVSTKGDGPNGRRIEGFLYKYRKGEEVRIVCVCHGSFLTPAEFVKHAGGGDEAHPLRHIVVNPTPSSFL